MRNLFQYGNRRKNMAKRKLIASDQLCTTLSVSNVCAKCSDGRNINLLPDCLLLEIFHSLSYIDRCRCSRVCRRWYKVTKDNSLQKIINVCELRLSVSDVWKLIYSHCCPALMDFRLKGFVLLLKEGKPQWKTITISQAALNELKKRSPILHKLTLREVFLAKDINSIGIAIRDMPLCLTHLSLRDSFLHPDIFFGSNPDIYVPNLSCLDMGGVTMLSSYDLHALSKLKMLNSLYLDGCFRINSGGIDHLIDILPQLQVLDIEGTDVSDEGLNSIFDYCINLEELYVGYTGLTDMAFKNLKQNDIPSLLTLCIIKTAVSSHGIQHLLSHFTVVQTFHLKASWHKDFCDLEKLFPNCKINMLEESDAITSRCLHFNVHKCRSK